MESALYGAPSGFYASGRGAGRRTGDFLTSVEVGPLFGRLIARLVDRCWEELGRPAEFTVVDAGAGRGTLARSVLAARPACATAGALRYVLVECSAALRQAHERLLERPPGPCTAIESLADLPPAPITGIVVANELLDNLPCRLLERTADGWAEVYVSPERATGAGELTEVLRPLAPEVQVTTAALAPDAPVGVRIPLAKAEVYVSPERPTGAGELTEVLRPLAPEVQVTAAALAPDAPVGGRIPVVEAAVAWVGRALDLLSRGTLVVIDYTDISTSLAARPHRGWLRTYRAGVRDHDPLVEPGSADITVEVPLDQIMAAHPGAEVGDQASFLQSLGIDDLVAEGRTLWQERAAVGDLTALEARSRIHEAEALCDPSGLGAFTVALWRR